MILVSTLLTLPISCSRSSFIFSPLMSLVSMPLHQPLPGSHPRPCHYQSLKPLQNLSFQASHSPSEDVAWGRRRDREQRLRFPAHCDPCSLSPNPLPSSHFVRLCSAKTHISQLKPSLCLLCPHTPRAERG